jgi:drug/metabolite transporter (DMT)-like permease
MSDAKKGYLYAFMAALIWCGFILVSRMGGISDLLPQDVIFIRYLTCSVILLPLWWFKWRFNLFNWKLLVCSLIGGLGYAICAFTGFELAPASHAAVLLPGLMPLCIIVFSFLINGERHAMQKWLGTWVITFGIVTLFLSYYTQNQTLSMGHVYLVLASLCWAIFSVLIKRWEITPWQVTVSLGAITCVIYAPVYVLFLPKAIASAPWSDILLQGFYQGVMATIVQMIFYVKAVQAIGPSNMGAVMAIVPVLSGILAILIFKEPASLELMIGLVLVSFGAWLAHSQLFKNKLFFLNNSAK